MDVEALIERPVLIGTEAYVSPVYARAEGERLWNRVWQVTCREEEIAAVGDFVTRRCRLGKFFFEKKNQKTFFRCPLLPAHAWKIGTAQNR